MILMFSISQSQSVKKKIDSQELYETELEKHLFPSIDTLNSKQIFLFVSNPEIEPNSSLRIINIAEDLYLEARYLEKNIWYELLTSLAEHRYKPLSLKTHFFSAKISRCFSNRIFTVFNKILFLQEGKKELKENWIFDGTCYLYVINDNGKIKTASVNDDLDSTDFRSQVTNTNLQIINDLKKGTFDESKYEIYR